MLAPSPLQTQKCAKRLAGHAWTASHSHRRVSTRLLPVCYRPQRHAARTVAAAAAAAAEPADRSRSRPRAARRRGPDSGSRRVTVNPARAEAVKLLMRIEYGGAFTSQVTGRVTGEQQRPGSGPGSYGAVEGDEDEDLGAASKAVRQMQPRDRRLVKELVAGVTRWRRRLDYFITGASENTPADKLEPVMLQVLRMAVYELVYCSLPPHALSQHVELAKALRPGAGRLANGILRNVAAAAAAGTLPSPEVEMKGDSPRAVVRQLAVSYSHPNWLVSRWLQRYGQEATQQLLAANNERPVYSLRVNTAGGVTAGGLLELLQQLEGVEAERSPYLPEDFLRVKVGLQAVLQADLVAKGQCTIQDEATGLVVAMVGVQPGQHILDACAAPGGKTLYMASQLKGKGQVLAVDINDTRLQAVQRGAERLGLQQVVTCCAADLRDLAGQHAAAAAAAETRSSPGRGKQPQQQGPWDVVLLDAPCSGTGVLAKRADLRWRRTAEQLEELAGLQSELLDAAAELVRPGGLLVYSTCCIEPEENVQQVQAFLERHAGRFQLEAPPAGAVAAELLLEGKYLATLPHVHGVDGAFAARLRRRDTA